MVAGLFFAIEVAADDGLLAKLRPLDGERAIGLADDAVGGFHQQIMRPLGGQHIPRMEEARPALIAALGGFLTPTVCAAIIRSPASSRGRCRAGLGNRAVFVALAGSNLDRADANAYLRVGVPKLGNAGDGKKRAPRPGNP